MLTKRFKKLVALTTLVMVLITSMMMPGNVSAATGTLTVNFGTTTLTGTPNVFGGCKAPQQAQQANVYPQLVDAGVTRVRGDYYFEAIIPTSLCSSLADYKNNVNNIQDPSKWSYGHLFYVDAAKSYGLKTLMVADYCPLWLSYSGWQFGVPKDWGVWEDIVKKVYTIYQSKTDWVELWNEPDLSTVDITGSPYSTKEDALVDLMYHTVTAIRSVNSNAKIGGFAFSSYNSTMLQTILSKAIAKYGKSWVDSNFNFISWHQYGIDCGSVSVSSWNSVLSGLGLSTNKDFYVDEWNYTANWQGTYDELHTEKAIGFAGRALSKFINAGVGADYFSLYPYNYPLTNTIHEDGVLTTLSFYTANGSTGTLLPQSYPFRILSNKLGLGKGNYAVKSISNQTVIDACAATNSAGQKVVFISNYYNTSNSVNITLNGLLGSSAAITEYWGTASNNGSNPSVTNNLSISNGAATYTVNMSANSVVGLIIADGGSGTYYRLKNRAQTNQYMNIENKTGKVQSTSISSDWLSAQWQLIPTDSGYFYIQNHWTGDCINVEDQLGYAEYSPLKSGGMWSAQWQFVTTDSGYGYLQNRWQPNEYLNIENNLGYVEYSALKTGGMWSAQWYEEAVK